MLNRLVIRNYAIITELDIDFSNGLTIITGEFAARAKDAAAPGQFAQSMFVERVLCDVDRGRHVASHRLADFGSCIVTHCRVRSSSHGRS